MQQTPPHEKLGLWKKSFYKAFFIKHALCGQNEFSFVNSSKDSVFGAAF